MWQNGLNIYCFQETVFKCLQELLLILTTISRDTQNCHRSRFTDKETEAEQKFATCLHHTLERSSTRFWTGTILFQSAVPIRILPGVTTWAFSGLTEKKAFWNDSLYLKRRFVLIYAINVRGICKVCCVPIRSYFKSMLIFW